MVHSPQGQGRETAAAGIPEGISCRGGRLSLKMKNAYPLCSRGVPDFLRFDKSVAASNHKSPTTPYLVRLTCHIGKGSHKRQTTAFRQTKHLPAPPVHGAHEIRFDTVPPRTNHRYPHDGISASRASGTRSLRKRISFPRKAFPPLLPARNSTQSQRDFPPRRPP